MGTTGGVVEKVLEGSIGWELGIEPGDRVVAINGEPLKDLLDFQYHATASDLEVEVEKQSGERVVFDIEKEIDEDLGIGFTSAVFDRLRSCRNKCLFCFLDQMPKGLRATLYLKDDDYRLSFLHGSYITLTNLSKADIQRILAWRISPLYVSVHATQSSVRGLLLGISPRRAEIMPLLRRLAAGGIEMHTQIVLCPGLNDGGVLEASIMDLAGLYPAVRSLAVVPVGLTRFRSELPALEPVDAGGAARTIALVDEARHQLARRGIKEFVFCADEFYLKSGLPVPGESYYGDYPQLENGVGLVRLFIKEAMDELSRQSGAPRPRRVLVITGISAHPILAQVVEVLQARWAGLEIHCLAVANRFLGDSVTVAGLLSGGDIRDAARDLCLSFDEVLVPDVALREEADLFLDGLSVSELDRALDGRLRIVTSGGASFVRAVFGGDDQ